MNVQILDEITQGRFGSKALFRLIVSRIIKTVALCLIFTSLLWLLLLEDYALLFLSLGVISGLVIFWMWRFMENRFGGSRETEIPYRLPDVEELSEPKEAKQIRTVEN
jgi:hypothetical protein